MTILRGRSLDRHWMQEEGLSSAPPPLRFKIPLVHWSRETKAPESDRVRAMLFDMAGDVFNRRHRLEAPSLSDARRCLMWLRRCWIAYASGRKDLWRYCFAEAKLEWLKLVTAPLISRAGRAMLAEQGRHIDGIAAHGKQSGWPSKIAAAIRANPEASNRKLASIVGCGEVTIRRYRIKQN